MKLKILPSALEDLKAGWAFYETQQEGLRDYFQDSLFSDVDSLLLFAGIHSPIFGYHRMLSKRFPFAIYYTIEESEVIPVWRILDMRAEPESTEKKIDRR